MSTKYVNLNQPNLGSESSSSFFGNIMTAGANVNNTTWMIIGILLFFAILGIFYYMYYVSPYMYPKYKHNSEGDGESISPNGKTAELLFFSANWCPHCKAAQPVWEDLKAEYENKTINGYKIIFTAIDCSEETAEVEKMMNQYNVEGYPTIKLLKDGQVITYDAKPTKETLTKFLNTVL